MTHSPKLLAPIALLTLSACVVKLPGNLEGGQDEGDTLGEADADEGLPTAESSSEGCDDEGDPPLESCETGDITAESAESSEGLPTAESSEGLPTAESAEESESETQTTDDGNDTDPIDAALSSWGLERFQSQVNLSHIYPHFGDFDGDGDLDIINYRGNGVDLVENLGNGEFVISGSRDFNLPVTAVAPGDFDGDGIDDLVFYDGQSGADKVYVLMSEGPFELGPPQAVTSPGDGDIGWSVVAFDVNGDDEDDLIVRTQNGGGTVLLSWFGGFDPWLPIAPPSCHIDEFLVGDLDLHPDGFEDLMTVGKCDGDLNPIQLGVHLRGEPINPYTQTQLVMDPDHSLIGMPARLHDFDGDGDLDFIAQLNHEDGMSVSLNDGAGGYEAPLALDYSVVDMEYMVFPLDLEDGQVAYVLDQDWLRQLVSVLFVTPELTLQTEQVYHYELHGTVVGSADFDNDGRADLLVRDTFGEDMSVWTAGGWGP
ncbi:FG-GAP-like repeat-containing protein [Plesiocystis pacifica]|nr:FG-GAP-like repeat-containing protein [Plesiocystis pacifica]